MENNWHVVYTYPNAEKRIAAELNSREITTFLPLFTVVKQWSDRKKKIDTPLFPNYVFVQVARKEYYKVLSVAGVTRFITQQGKPAVIREKEINTIRMITSLDINATTEKFMNVGDRVRVKAGPLLGMEGTLVDKNGKKRFYIRFDSIEQAVSIAIDPKCLELTE